MTAKLHYLIELGPTKTGTVIRSQEMTPEEAKEANSKMYVIKWVSADELEAELKRLKGATNQ